MLCFPIFAPVRKTKQTVILQDILVEDYAAEGKSLARVNGKVIFIEKAVPGDVVDVQLFKSKKDWAEGWPIQYKKYSEDRVVPFCSHFGICGGCQWQMLPYTKQLVYKQKQVMDNLSRIAKVALPAPFAIIGANETKNYRNKVEYTFTTKKYIPEEEFRQSLTEGKEIKNEGCFAGFHAKGSFDKVVEIDVCHLMEEPNNLIRKSIAEFVAGQGFSFYDIRNHEGWLRSMMLRIATTGEILLNVVLGYEDVAQRKLLMEYIRKQFPQITTLLYTINTKFNDSIADLEPEIYYGKGHIIEQLENFKFKISPKSFFQTNTKQAENLYKVARNFAELDGSQVVYDLYCGTGSIGIFVSKQAKKVIGVEVVKEAVDDAKENAALNNINHALFFTGDVMNVCDDNFFAEHGKPDVIITDPPRAGMHEKLVKKLLEIEAPVVVYVSCNPATQARDLALLDEKYTITKIQPVDMFPQTHHIENVVQLKLK